MSRLSANISRFSVILALCCSLLLAGSCIRENIDDCPVTVELAFRYYGDGITDVFSERVDSVSMWVYRLDGTFRSGERISAAALDTLQGVRLSLPQGDWRLVFWGNDGESSHVDPRNLEEMIATEEYRSGDTPDRLDRLYHATVDLSLPMTLRVQRDTVEFHSSSVAVTVEMVGFENLDAGSSGVPQLSSDDDEPEILFRHSDIHAAIGWDNTSSDSRITYEPDISRVDSTGSLITHYRVPRFDDSDCGTLEIHTADGSSQLWSGDLASIMAEQGITTEGIEEAHVRLKIVRTVDGINGYVQIRVVPWDSEIVYPIL